MSIALAYTADDATAYNLVIHNFSDNAIPRQYNNTANFEYGLAGTTRLSGPAFKQKYIWVIDALIPETDAAILDSMFRAWDEDRSNGLSVALGLSDNCFGATIDTSVVFSTAPSYTYNGPSYRGVSFALSEV